MFEKISISIDSSSDQSNGQQSLPACAALPLMSPGMLQDVPTPVCTEPRGAGSHGENPASMHRCPSPDVRHRNKPVLQAMIPDTLEANRPRPRAIW